MTRHMSDCMRNARVVTEAEQPVEPGASISLKQLWLGTRIRVQTWSNDLSLGTLESSTGATWPMEVGEVSGKRCRVLCTGPGNWLVVCDGRPETLMQELERAAAGLSLCVTDMSQGVVAVEVAGTLARELLSKGCGLDFHARAFPAGRCTRTRFAGLAVTIDAIEDTVFHCYVRRSHAQYLFDWLSDAAIDLEDAP
jgi:sarcosine oxidase, subunit gamma